MTYLLRLVKDGIENEGESAHPTSGRARAAGAAFTGSRGWWWNGDADVSVKGRRSAYVTLLTDQSPGVRALSSGGDDARPFPSPTPPGAGALTASAAASLGRK